jgi:tRNA A37 threonylcarbamoyladenosine dehydratase
VPLITVGGAGGKRDASRLTVADLAHTTQDPLAASVRYQLRRQHGFARGGAAFGVPCVYSTEPMQTPDTHCAPGLQCGGYGSAVVVTATAGMLAAGYVLNALVAA